MGADDGDIISLDVDGDAPFLLNESILENDRFGLIFVPLPLGLSEVTGVAESSISRRIFSK